MKESHVIMLASQMAAHQKTYPVAEGPECFDVLKDVSDLMQLVKCHYDRAQYQATLCDPAPNSRMYKMVCGFGTEAGAIYRLTEKP